MKVDPTKQVPWGRQDILSGKPERLLDYFKKLIRYLTESYEDLANAINYNERGIIVESGSNSNGSYVRWADGTQVCWLTEDVNATADCSVTASGVWRSHTSLNEHYTWGFPSSFAYTPTVIASAPKNLGHRNWADSTSVTTTGCSLIAFSSDNADTGVVVTAIAIGSWK
jgi:hypothetical protein